MQGGLRAALALLLLSLALAPAAPAAPTAVSWPLLDVVTLDSADPSTPADPAAATATASLTSTGAETRVIARFPAAVFERDTNLLTRAELSLEFRAATWSPTRPLVLHALTNAYDAAAATWTDRAADTPWRKPGGDPVDRYCITAAVTSVTAGLWRATWNIRPLLWRGITCGCIASNGILVRMGGSRPSSGTIAAPFDTASADLYLVWQDPFLSTHDYAISGISNGPFHKEYATNATDETVWWEQDITTVGRVMLQTNGFESRAILCMPRELRELDPDRIQRIEGHFEAYINTWSGERIALHPVTSPTRLEMAGNRPYNGANPTHGPSWRWADGPVDTNNLAYPRIPWRTPGGDFDETVSADATLVKLSQYIDAAIFDLTPLWRDARVRGLLLTNGAIIKADRSTWSGTNLCAVQIYCSDGYTQTYKGADSTFRITEYPPPEAPPAVLAPDALFYIDALSPDWCSLGVTRVQIIHNQDPAKGDTHGLLHFPADLATLDPATLETATFHCQADRNSTVSAAIYLHLLQQPFTHTTQFESATWNHASTGGAAGTVPWATPGAPYDPATKSPGTYDPATQTLTFDLTPLLASPDAWRQAVTNGFLLRIDPSWTDFADKTFVRYTIPSATAELTLTTRPLTISIIDSSTPDTPSPCTTNAPIPLLLSEDAETRALLRFDDSVFTQNPRQIADIRLFLNSASPLPADCTLHLTPLSTPVRLKEATWLRASQTTPWTTPGGDLGIPSLPATRSTGATGYYIDLSPLLRDPATAAALRANGALLHLVRTTETTTPLAWTASYPSLMTIPADLFISSMTQTTNGLSLEISGLDPAADYEVQATGTVDSTTGWTPLAPVPRNGTVVLPPATNASGFYRIRQAD